MSQQSTKLSPAEFLAELKRTRTAPRAAPPPPRREPAAAADAPVATVPATRTDATRAAIEELDLDFSDLDEAAPAPPARANGHPAPVHSEPAGRAPLPVEEEARQHEAPVEAPAHHEPDANDIASQDGDPEAPLRQTAIRSNPHLDELFHRVNQLLGGGSDAATEGPFRPRIPASLEDARLTSEEVERLVLKYLLSKGSGSGRVLSGQVKLPFNIVDPILKQLKQEQLLTYKGAAEVGDYDYAITDFGRERARRYNDECSYFGAAPVSLQDYLEAMAAQSIAKQEVTEDDLKRAFSDLIINQDLLETLGPAINSGRGMFLFGEPGNGKTSIAERITRCFGSTIWIPRALGIDGDIIRVYDPGIHDLVEEQQAEKSLFDLSGVDQRWVQVVRPTIIAGGELTMKELEVTQNAQTKICEAPLQLKSNCGTLVIDDFGRQTMPVDVLLNRWIVPLEKRYDFLNLPSGKKVQVPFDQLIIFSTNLEPKDLVDGAFLRRIPYKIQAPDPSEDEFHRLFQLMAPKLGFPYERSAVEYLIEKHYRNKRPFRACQPRDLLLQVKNYCVYRKLPRKLSPEAFDFAVKNYFSVL